MKQVVQNLKSGELELLDVACPQVARGQVLIQSRASLISSGTERSLLAFGQAGWISKAQQQPERVRQVLDKIKTDGLMPTVEAVMAKLDEPMAVGYCNAGQVVEVGAGVSDFAVGQRVVSNGNHAEMVARPVNLCAAIPDDVSDEEAPFAVLGAIGMQGVRLLELSIGETVAVSGLGLIGLLAAQILMAGGMQVLGLDVDPQRLKLAESLGVIPVDLAAGADPIAAAMSVTHGHGVDGVLIAADAKNDQIISQAARMSRKRGRIVLVGAVNMELNRTDFYEKELTFQVSCSYGPGRYDKIYEDGGVDYPIGFVRWTERRNIEAVLALMAAGKIQIQPLISSRVPQAEAVRAYQLLSDDRDQLGIVLEYPHGTAPVNRLVPSKSVVAAGAPTGNTVLGIIGAGTFTKGVLLPVLSQSGAKLASIASANGISGAICARKFNIAASTSDYRTILQDPAINAVAITTRHNLHAQMVVESLDAGKHVFVEKPLAIDQAGLDLVKSAAARHPNLQLLVGYNRRFSPQAVQMQKLLAGRSQPACLTMLVNADRLQTGHWLHDPVVAGGRMVGEGCHWFDLMSYLVGSRIAAVQAMSTANISGPTGVDNQVSVNLYFADGSLGTLQYFANGHRSFPKERLTVFCQGTILELDNFRKLYGYGWPKFSKLNLFRQDKGHRSELQAFVERVTQGGPQLIDFASLYNVTAATLAVQQSASSGQRVEVANG